MIVFIFLLLLTLRIGEMYPLEKYALQFYCYNATAEADQKKKKKKDH